MLSKTVGDPTLSRSDRYVWFLQNNSDVLIEAMMTSQRLRMEDREVAISEDDDQDAQVTTIVLLLHAMEVLVIVVPAAFMVRPGQLK